MISEPILNKCPIDVINNPIRKIIKWLGKGKILLIKCSINAAQMAIEYSLLWSNK